MKELSVLFVCLGNICRSPTAEGVFRAKVEARQLQSRLRIDSAGTAEWHTGKAPDARTVRAAATRGYDLAPLRARQAIAEDFHEFDYILAMDKSNLQDLQAIQPSDGKAKLALFLSYANDSAYSEVPDPYHGGAAGFDLVLDLVESAADGLLAELESRLHA